jgi:hypothetical protein
MTQQLKLYTTLLNSQRLGSETQRRILDLATIHKKTALVARLAKRADLAPEIDQALRKVTAAPVRAAWLARPGRPACEIEAFAMTETRVSVCEVIAAAPGLTSRVYEEMLSRDLIAVHAALAGNPDVSLDIRKRAALAVAGMEEHYYDHVEAVDKLIELEPAFVNAVVQAATTAVDYWADHPALTGVGLTHLTARLTNYLRSDETSRHSGYRYGSLLKKLTGHPGLTSELAVAILTELLEPDGSPKQFDEKRMAAISADVYTSLRQAASNVIPTRPDVNGVAALTDPAGLHDLTLKAIEASDRDLMIAAAGNRHATRQTLRALSKAFARSVPAEVVEANQDRPENLAILLSAGGLYETDLNRVADPTAVLIAYIRLRRQLSGGRGTWLTNIEMMNRKHFTGPVLLELPARALISDDFEVLHPALATAAADIVDDGAVWSVFESLLDADETLSLRECAEAAQLAVHGG